MVSVESGGRLLFAVHAPEAASVLVVGAFTGWHEQRIPLAPYPDGWWRAEIDPGPGEYLFRYLVDGSEWALDPGAHGSRVTVNGMVKSRVWCPPADTTGFAA